MAKPCIDADTPQSIIIWLYHSHHRIWCKPMSLSTTWKHAFCPVSPANAPGILEKICFVLVDKAVYRGQPPAQTCVAAYLVGQAISGASISGPSNGPDGLPIPKFRPNYRGRSLHSNCHFQLSLTVISQLKHDLLPHWPAKVYNSYTVLFQ